MENLWNPWNLPVLAGGRFPSPIPAGRTLQQVPIETVVEFASHVIGRRDDFVGSRIEIASDELNALEAAEVVAGLVGRGLDVDDHVSGGPLPLFSWLDQVGYTIELGDLRTRFPDVAWRRFSEWAKTQDWSILASQPSPL